MLSLANIEDSVCKEFCRLKQEDIIKSFKDSKNVNCGTISKIIDELYNVYGIEAVKFIPYINIKNIDREEAIKVLGKLMSIPLLHALISDEREDEDEGIDVNWHYYYLRSQKDLAESKKQIESLRREIESIKDSLKPPEISDEMIEKYVNVDSIQAVKESLQNPEKKQGPLLDALRNAIEMGDAISTEAFAQRIDLNNSMILGNPPLSFACNRSTPEVVEALIRSGADPNNKEREDGHTALIRACTNLKYGPEIVALLLSHGARPNDDNEYKYTPLHVAVNCGRHDIARLLVRAGANTDAKEEGGHTPVDLAHDKEMLELLTSERQKYLDNTSKPNPK